VNITINQGFLSADIYSIIALLIALFSLAWNIIRDLIVSRTKLIIKVNYGEIRNIKGTDRGIFIKRNKNSTKEAGRQVLLFDIVNSGNKTIVVEEIRARNKISIFEKKKGSKYMSIVCEKLPKALKPYETFKYYSGKNELIDCLKNKKIEYFSARDTKEKDWKTSRKNIKELIRIIG